MRNEIMPRQSKLSIINRRIEGWNKAEQRQPHPFFVENHALVRAVLAFAGAFFFVLFLAYVSR